MTDTGRRSFFKRILAGAAAAAVASELDPERLLWVPGAKSFFLPPEKTVGQATLIHEASAIPESVPEMSLASVLAQTSMDKAWARQMLRDADAERQDPDRFTLSLSGNAYRHDIQNGATFHGIGRLIVDGQEVRGAERQKLHDAMARKLLLQDLGWEA